MVGILVIWLLPDKPRHAKWLTAEESEALESQLEEERRIQASAGHVSLIEALTSPRVLWLSFAYFGIVTANYGIEFFLPSILSDWYKLTPQQAALYVMLPSLLVIPGQLFVGWSSDHFHERKWHSVLPVLAGRLDVGLGHVYAI